MIRYRSQFEAKIHAQTPQAQYEPVKLKYTQPQIERTYTPDFVLTRADGHVIYIETKGILDNDGRKKLIMVKASHPLLDIRLVFYRAKDPIRKGSKTTLGMWASKHGFPWAEGKIPEEWK